MTESHYPDTQLLIANTWVDAQDGRKQEVLNPANGHIIGHVACASLQDLDQALAAAQAGFNDWRAMPAYKRAEIMRKAAALLRERAVHIARLMTQEQGKPLQESQAEVLAGASTLEWFADEGLRIYGRLVPARHPNMQQYVLKEPVGPVAAFTPWNFPINQVVRKLGAALATGCSFLCKAAEETPASPAALMQTFVDAGAPAGVVGLVYGDPEQISSYLIPHPIIRKVTFTGSTAVGKRLAALAGLHMKRTTMELGGHAPVIIARDANLEQAIHAMARAKFRNAGQVCISPTRFLVHRSLLDDVAQGLVHYAENLQLGDGLDAKTSLGPLANPRRISAMKLLVEDAHSQGARILTGGERLDTEGNFFTPTVISHLSTHTALFNQEPFGPIAGLWAFDDLDEAITEANRLPYGLAAYAFTRSYENVHKLLTRLETGMLWVNQAATPSPELPFGGVKESGYGSEGGPEALEAYLNTKAASVTAS
ncbi:NAD-dependent succinate-semialdehyde dehydrogenase [Castellaniella sp.]|uniref:NAD-dependent succinate-semialdehyde dehydrogenase n=1 Tax=Castellaniella sp. TaxID=1955812 RepID=UPI003A926435